MRIAVVTPYHREDASTLYDCHRSVQSQSVPCTHVMVADGFPSAEVRSWPVDHIILPCAHNDIGSTPRLIGSFHAVGLGFDGIAFLDADNWYRFDHVETLLNLHRRGAATFLSSSRFLCRLDGSVMALCPASDGKKFVDTSCMLLMRPAFGLLANWCLMPEYAQVISDRVFLYLAKVAGAVFDHSAEPTVYYRCQRSDIYRKMGETPPPGVLPMPDYGTAFQRWVAEGNPPLV